MRLSPVFGLMATNIFLSGAAFAAITPYRAIVGVETLGLSNGLYALVMVLNALGGAAAAVALGWFSDRVADRRWLVLLCALVGAAGFTLIWTVQTPLAYLASFCLLMPFGNALFSQSFSYSRAYYNRENPDRAEFMMSFLRSLFTLAWIVFPPLAGWLAAATSSFAVFAMGALMHVGCTLMVGLLFLVPSGKVGTGDAGGTIADARRLSLSDFRSGHLVGIAGVTLALVAIQINMNVLPLVIVRDLGGTLGDVGINAAVAAAIEVPVMIGWGYLAMRIHKETILAIATGLFGVYLGLVALAGSVLEVLLLQVLAAISIAALLSITISYVQESIRDRVGLATSIYDVARVASVMLASAVFAANAGTLYGPLMGITAVACFVGAGLFFVAGRIHHSA